MTGPMHIKHEVWNCVQVCEIVRFEYGLMILSSYGVGGSEARRLGANASRRKRISEASVDDYPDYSYRVRTNKLVPQLYPAALFCYSAVCTRHFIVY